MRTLTVSNDANMINVFPAVDVIGKHRTKSEYGQEDNVLELVDAVTGRVVLEVGTDNVDDYYPGFVASFHPENMATNAEIAAAEEAAARAADGWIDWSGGDMPVSEDTLVQIKAGFDTGDAAAPARAWMWDHNRPQRECIVAYRVVEVAA